MVLHYGYLHPMLALDDMCYPGAAVWGNISELGAIIRGIDAAWLAEQRGAVEAHLAQFGSAGQIVEALGDTLMAPVPAEEIPVISVPETHHELRRLMTETIALSVFREV